MNQNQFNNKHKNLGLSESELKSKWQRHIREQEDLKLYDELRKRRAAGSASSAVAPGGGASFTVSPLGSGSVEFNGTNQFIRVSNATVNNWLPGTGDFTIEWFMKKGANSPLESIFALGLNDESSTIGATIESTGTTIYIWPYGIELTGTLPVGFTAGTDWVHIAICRSGTTTKLFIDGALAMTKLLDNNNIGPLVNPGYNMNMGVDFGAGDWFSGKLTNFRWDNSAIYTGSSLTVPVAPLSQTPTTKVLMLGGSAANPVQDATGINTLQNLGAVWNADTPF